MNKTHLSENISVSRKSSVISGRKNSRNVTVLCSQQKVFMEDNDGNFNKDFNKKNL